MDGHSKVTRTDSSGSQASVDSLGSSADWRIRSSLAGSANGLAVATPNLHKLLSLLPPELRNTSWEVRNEVSRHLNPLKDPVGNDYRKVASRLGFKVEDIDWLRKAHNNPTIALIGLCSNTSCEEFFVQVQNIDRSDVIEDLLSYLSQKSNRLPTQESLEDDDLVHPLEESCSNLSKLSKLPSEQEHDEEEKTAIPFEESQEFWCKIPGPYSKKKWPDFCTAMKEACPKEADHSGIDKFLCHVFKIDFTDARIEGEVRVEYFSRLLSCFGPFKPGQDGCLEKIYALMTKSLSKSRDGKQHSWFAGYMNQQETEERLNKHTPGHYLIRFSSSKVDDGWFILGVKMDDDVLQVEIKRDVIGRKHLLAEEPFEDLASIVKKLHKEIFLEECPRVLSHPCPDLPLNINFIGYTTATHKRQ